MDRLWHIFFSRAVYFHFAKIKWRHWFYRRVLPEDLSSYFDIPDIGKTITIIFYPATLARTQYVSGDTVILSIGDFILSIRGSRLFPRISVCVVPINTQWFVYCRCFRFNSMNHMEHVLNKYFNRPNPRDDAAKL